MSELEKFVRDILNDKAKKRVGTTMQVDTMADMLLEDERNNGTYTYDRQKSIDIIYKYWDDIFKYSYFTDENPFDNPELFLVDIMLVVAFDVIDNTIPYTVDEVTIKENMF